MSVSGAPFSPARSGHFQAENQTDKVRKKEKQLAKAQELFKSFSSLKGKLSPGDQEAFNKLMKAINPPVNGKGGISKGGSFTVSIAKERLTIAIEDLRRAIAPPQQTPQPPPVAQAKPKPEATPSAAASKPDDKAATTTVAAPKPAAPDTTPKPATAAASKPATGDKADATAAAPKPATVAAPKPATGDKPASLTPSGSSWKGKLVGVIILVAGLFMLSRVPGVRSWLSKMQVTLGSLPQLLKR